MPRDDRQLHSFFNAALLVLILAFGAIYVVRPDIPRRDIIEVVLLVLLGVLAVARFILFKVRS